MANEFKVKKGLVVNGSGSVILDVQGSQGQLFSVTDQLSGSLFSVNDISGIPVMEAFSDTTVKIGQYNAEAIIVSGSNARITGSLFGTASWASNAISASIAANAVSASFASTASYVLQAVSASFASTASSADNFLVRGTLTAQTIVAQTITSSTDFVTGSTRFGTLLANTHQFTGSVSITGSLNVVGAGITGSLLGTASRADNATSASFSSTAVSASFATNALSASFAPTATNVFLQGGNSFGATALLGTNDVQDLQFETSGSVRMTISGSNGSVGIGSTSPTATLTVSKAASNFMFDLENASEAAFKLRTYNSGSVSSGTAVFTQGLYYSTTENASIKFHRGSSTTGGFLTFTTNDGTEKMRITTDGNVGIGNTSPTVRLQVNGDTLLIGSGATSATNALVVQNSAGTNLLQLRNDSDVFIGTNSWLAIGSGQRYIYRYLNTTGIFSIGNDSTVSSVFNLYGSTHATKPSTNEIVSAYAPTSGTIQHTTLAILSSINQTGGANGTTRGLYINPTLTAAADWRSIEWSNSTGFGLYGAGTANNYLGGALGIGTTSPLASIHTSGGGDRSIIIESTTTATTTSAYIKYIRSTTGSARTWWTGVGIQGGADDSYSFYDQTAGAERMRITSAGNVGIGTTAPARLLHIKAGAGVAGAIRVDSDNGNVANVLEVPTNGDWSFSTNSQEVMRLSNANGGRVGIGTTSPNAKLDVNGNTIISGSLTVVTGSAVELQVTNTGVKIGNVITDVHTVTGSLGISGSVTATNFTGSLFGTASWANNATTASYVLNAVSASFASTASYVLQAVSSSFASTASYVLNAVSASFASTASFVQNAQTASYVLNAISASFASTASSADNFLVRGTLTAQTIVAQVITSSTDFVTGSTRFGTLLANTHQFTGSVSITGSLAVVTNNGVEFQVADTGVKIGNVITDAHTTTGSVSVSGSVTSSGGFIATGSYNLLQSNGGNLFINSSGQIGNTSTGTHITISPTANTTILSQVVTTNNGLNVSPGGNSTTYALEITSGSYPAATLLRVGSNILTVTGSNVGINKAAPNSALDIVGNTLITGSLNVTSGITGSLFGTSSWANNAISASFATTTSNVLGGATNYIPLWNSATTLSSSVMYQTGSNIGIGTTSPAYKLDVAGSTNTAGLYSRGANLGFESQIAVFGANGSYQAGYYLGATNTVYAARIGMDVNSGDVYIGAGTTSSLSTIAYFKADGNVGIGTTSPTAKLHVSGTTGGVFEVDGAAAVNALYVSASGFVGIGTTTPAAILEVSSNAGRLRITQNTAGSVLNGLEFAAFNGTIYGGLIGNQNTGEIRLNTVSTYFPTFYSNGSEVMRITTTGNVGIGTTSPTATLTVSKAASNFMFDLENASEALFKLRTYNSGSAATGTAVFTQGLYYSTTENASIKFHRGSSTTGGFLTFTTNDGTEKMRITTDGNVGIGTTNPTQKLTIGSSDSDAAIINAAGRLYFRDTTTYINEGSGLNLVAGSTRPIILSADGSERVRIAVGGNVGIGTTTPTLARLQVNGNVHATSFTGSFSGSLTGLASNATSASYAATASYATNFTVASSLIIDQTLTDYASVAASSVGSNNLFSQNTGSYTSAFFKYTCASGSSARAGEVVAVWNGTTAQFTDFSTVDVGNTTAVTSSAVIVTGQIQFNMQTNSSGWAIKSIATFM